MTLPRAVTITEVGMRDGFQMEAITLPTDIKVEIACALIDAGVRHLEATSFVSPTLVPQLADADDLVPRLKRVGAELSALTPNGRGALRAASAGVDRMLFFVSASETHNLCNVNRTIDHSLKGFAEVAEVARDAGAALSGVIATAFGCPFEGDIPVANVLRIVDMLVAGGIDELVLGDTTGMATPPIVRGVCEAILKCYPRLPISLHFHNTRGLGLVNVMAGLEFGVERYQASVGGLGGCPFAPGATGNVCTEDLVNLLDGLGIETGIDVRSFVAIARRLEVLFDRSLPGQVMRAGPRMGIAV